MQKERKLLFTAILIAACAVVTIASSTSRDRRHVGLEVSSHLSDRRRSLKWPSGRDNEITTETGRKVSHRLIGGHLRADAKQEIDETEPETESDIESYWDDGILLSSAGNGKETKPGRKEEEDERKTLSQQVKEGKYGLIQNEIHDKRSKRPGIISYLGNPEVPGDTADNLGGLDEDEIWLAENHVLVLRGGKFPGHEASQTQGSGDAQQSWPPIDDYKAPRRQVKIPAKPKVPPPFPVQLTEGGPVQIIGINGTKEIGNFSLDYANNPLLANGLLSQDAPLFAVIANGTILTHRTENQARNQSSNEDGNEKDKSDPLPPGSFPPFYHAIPPGAVFVPPPSNHTDYDEEDQSIYYPPPYSFQYQQDNATAVPPGPLVPGIILPPPPDFFAALENEKTGTPKNPRRPGTTPLPRPRPTYLPPRKLSTERQKSTTVSPTMKPRSPVNSKLFTRPPRRNLTETTGRPGPRTISEPYAEIATSTPQPDVSTTLEKDIYGRRPLTENQVSSQENSEKKNGGLSRLGQSSKSIPTMEYHATSTQSTLEKPVEVTPAAVKTIVTTGNPERAPSRASYYFYEESSEERTETTPDAFYYETSSQTPETLFETVIETATPSVPAEKKRQFHGVEAVPSQQQPSKDFGILGTPVKIGQPVRESAIVAQSGGKYERSQGQRMLPDREPLYYQSVTTRPVQAYYSTAKPRAYYREETKPKPIYQYSFEAADYSRQDAHRQQYERQRTGSYTEHRALEIGETFDAANRYDYENESVPRRRGRPTEVYKIQRPIYPSTSGRSVIDTTPNPRHLYYTQQEEKLLDEVTKEYFTIFGKKIPRKGVPGTTPIYPTRTGVTERPAYTPNRYVENSYEPPTPVYNTPNVKVHYGDQSRKPYSLKDDILVNFRQPLPPINPDSEFIGALNPQQPRDYELSTNSDSESLAPIRTYTAAPLAHSPGNGPPTNYVPVADSSRIEDLDEVYPQLPISLEDDIKVNYRDPRPTIDPDAEFIEPIPATENQAGKPKAYFAYRLPGDGGHFYFLTPQAVTQRPERNAAHRYTKTRASRLLRRRRRPGNV